ncbi:hypothetical protein G5I_00858 [Acromyrmex echinatior]|uniref:Uncharacterized protein n=1 Tax=Acromyrmex echinatior TaxID=103372 RepID=F4W607_ACREC|nr:hypothetical protein G5I_00858 [Acromyrmex echinatior]
MLLGSDREKAIDHVYDSENGTMLGDKYFDVDTNDFAIVDGVKYKSTLGFIMDERFVVKEVAILRNGREMTHYVFMCPMPWRFLTKKDQSHASWLMAHHGLR